jgi:hypothetical protein
MCLATSAKGGLRALGIVLRQQINYHAYVNH